MTRYFLLCLMLFGLHSYAEDFLCKSTIDGISINSIVGVSHEVMDTLDVCYVADSGSEVIVRVDGNIMVSATNSGCFVWMPRSNGEYELSLELQLDSRWCIAGMTCWTTRLDVVGVCMNTPLSPTPPTTEDSNLNISPVDALISSAGGMVAISTYGDGQVWTASSSEQWIKLKSTEGDVGKPCAYLIEQNMDAECRRGYVYINGHVHSVSQEGRGCTVLPETMSIGCDGGKRPFDVKVSQGVSWGVSANVDWLSVERRQGTNDAIVVVSVAPFHEVNSRVGYLTVGGQSVMVVQNGCTMKLSSSNEKVDCGNNVVMVSVEAFGETKWSVSPNVDWIKVIAPGSGSGSGCVCLSVSANDGYVSRSGTVMIGTETFVLIQEGTSDVRLTVTPETFDIFAAATNWYFTVNATPALPWNVKSCCDWLAVDSSSNAGSGDGVVVFAVSANRLLSERVGCLEIMPDKESGLDVRQFTVIQEAAHSAISAEECMFDATGGTCVVDVAVEDGVAWTAVSQDPWVSVIDGTSRVGQGSVTIVASANNSSGQRSGTVKIAAKTFRITQKSRRVRVTRDAFVFTAMSSGAEFDVIPDGDMVWKAVTSDDSWLILFEDEERSGTQKVHFAVTELCDYNTSRTGMITIGDTRVYVTQRSFELSLVDTCVSVGRRAYEGNFDLITDSDSVFSVLSTVTWIKIGEIVEKDVGLRCVQFELSENDTGLSRFGKIIVAGEVFEVEQSATLDCIPDLGDIPAKEAVETVMGNAVDCRLRSNIDAGNYNMFRQWARKLKESDGEMSGVNSIFTSSNAWFSFALDSDKLIEVTPVQSDLQIDRFELSDAIGRFDMVFGLDGVEVGPEATKENLKKVFGVEGAATLSGSAFSSENVDLDFGTPVGGKIKCAVGPMDKAATSFFIKVRLK